jgi:RHS repeat-associated protein
MGLRDSGEVREAMKRIGILFVLFNVATGAFAQTSFNNLDGLTPVGLQPGSPAGSYALSDLDTINLYNGSANITIPLLQIGGRGEAGYAMVATYDAHWNATGVMSEIAPCSPLTPCPLWSFSLSGWANWDYLYRPAGIAIRHLGQGMTTVYSDGVAVCHVYTSTLTRLTVGLGDGTELSLVDSASDGAPSGPLSPPSCNLQGPSRGTTFVTTDGSAATFIADNPIYDVTFYGSTSSTQTPTGTLYFRDGRQFHFANYTIGGLTRTVIDSIQDRNGNRTTFNYTWTPPPGFQYGFAVIDPLGRSTNVAIGKPDNFTDDPHAGCTSGNPCPRRYDEITYDGTTGEPRRTIKVYRRSYWYDRIGSLQTATQPTHEDLFGGYASPSIRPFDWAISKILLPDNHEYKFHYDRYGEVVRLDLPTGGRYEFDWTNGPGEDPSGFCSANPENNNKCPVLRAPTHMQTSGYDLLISVYRRVRERREYVDGGLSWTRRTAYDVTESNEAVVGDPLGQCTTSSSNFLSGYCNRVTVNEYDPMQGHLSSEMHYFYGAVSRHQSLFPEPGWYAWGLEGREFRTDLIQPDGPTLRKKLQTWHQRAIPQWWSSNPSIGPQPAMDTRVGGNDVVVDGGKMARTLLIYSPSPLNNTNNVEELREYDYGDTSGSQGPLIRRTQTTFRSDYNNPSAGVYLRDLRWHQTVYDRFDNVVAQTELLYDEEALAPAPGIAQHVSMGSQRGNPTRVRRWRNTDAAWLTTIGTYDVAGNLRQLINPRGYITSYSYTDCPGKYAFLTTVTHVTASHTTTFGHDCNLGQVTSITDPEGFSTTAQYGNSGMDLLDRLSKVIRPNNQRIRYEYSADLRTVTTRSDQYGMDDQKLVSAGVTDGLGRTIETRLYTSPGDYIATKKDLDALGRTRKIYNPGSMTDGVSSTYDALGRVATITHPDGSQESFQWSGDTVLHTDPASKRRRQQVDALGRIVAVTEDPSGQVLVTGYAYDGLDNLISVTQGTQTRSFRYDSLGKLRSVINPEVDAAVTCLGQFVSECYTYDANGNLSRRNAPGVQTDFEYDSLDRLKKKMYSDGTPTVDYAYDTTQKGCLDSVANAVSMMAFTAYNPNCEVTASRQTFGHQNYDFNYAYNLASALTQVTYPSNRIVSYHYDEAGRADCVGKGPLSGQDCAANRYANGIVYANHGAIASMTLGNITESWQYNDRLQPTSLITSSGALNLAFYYCANGMSTCSTNNGNLLRQVITRNGTVWMQDYPTTAYDALNRLTTAQETSSAGSWAETYGYDRYGNRWLENYSGLPAPNNEVPRNPNWYLPNNRLAGWDYGDGRGNITSILNMSRTFTYDGENRQTTASINGATSTYSYDGDGRRIRKVSGLGTTLYIYDAFGNLAAEYADQPSTSGTQYFHVDHLGSTRLVSDANGTPIANGCHDYLPFGQEIVAGINGRGSCFPSTPSAGIEFTGKERDWETNLDYFGARYNSAAQGRFMSADSPFADQHAENPQSWNLYQYGYNNPLVNVDLDGRSVWSKAIKVAIKTYKTGDAASAFVDIASDFRTLAGPASPLQKLGAGLSLLSEVLPISVGDVRDAGRLLGFADGAVDAGKQLVRHGDEAASAAKSQASRSDVFITTPQGVTLPPNQDFNLVPTNRGANGAFLQIHGTHADNGVKPHTHVPQVHINRKTGRGRTVRTDRSTTAQDINRADRELREGKMRRRENRNDGGDI